MPVFTRLRDGVLVVTVDGDYTPGELSRAGERGLASDEVPSPVAVLLDMSGAAGLESKSQDDLRLTGEFFGEHREAMTRVAVLTPSDTAYDLLDSGGTFAESTGIPSRPFRDRAEAIEWLSGGEPGSGASEQRR